MDIELINNWIVSKLLIPEMKEAEAKLENAKEIFQAAVKSVLPSQLLPKKIIRHGDTIRIEKQLEIPLNQFRRCYVVGKHLRNEVFIKRAHKGCML